MLVNSNSDGNRYETKFYNCCVALGRSHGLVLPVSIVSIGPSIATGEET